MTPKNFVKWTLLMAVSFIITGSWRLYKFIDLLKTMYLVLVELRESLFTWNQEETLMSSKFKMLIREARFGCEKRIVVSSAKRIQDKRVEQQWRSLTYRRNSKGPRIEPCYIICLCNDRMHACEYMYMYMHVDVYHAGTNSGCMFNHSLTMEEGNPWFNISWKQYSTEWFLHTYAHNFTHIQCFWSKRVKRIYNYTCMVWIL